MSKIAPCLWFTGEAEDAARFYVSLFPEAAVVAVSRYGEGAPFPPGTAVLVEFTLAGQRFQALNGPVAFPHGEAISLSVRCRDQAEVDHYWEGLGAGGRPGRCGWLKDRYGVSWQVVPEVVGRLQEPGDPAASARMMAALLTMDKLDVAALERAYRGEG